MIKYIALDINIGLVGSQRISNERISFHEETVRLLYPGSGSIVRLGLTHSSPFDYNHLAYQPGFIGPLISNAIATVINSETHLDLLLIDFTSNAYDLIREPVLINLAEKLELLCSRHLCSTFLILLPELPGVATASMQRFTSTADHFPEEFNLTIFSNDGGIYSFSSEKAPVKIEPHDIQSRYKDITRELQENPEARLRKKLVRRLGHFRRPGHPNQCRVFSYVTDNCDEELISVLRGWWSSNQFDCEAILHDTKNNPSFTSSLKAFALEVGLKCYRVADALTQKRISREITNKKACLMVLDVVETGETLLGYAAALNQLGINVHKTVLTAISKAGDKLSIVGNYEVSSFLTTSMDSQHSHCIQCELNLPFTSETAENYFKLRAFDLWFMANEVDWQEEPEFPDNIGEPYPLIPIFPEMLSKFGDWIAYKMEHIINATNRPQNMFVIHPDEPGAISVSSKLRLRFDDQLVVVKVPRLAIKKAQLINNSWQDFFRKNSEKEEWIHQLESLSRTSALITDVFNASGSTFLSLYKLLEHFDITAYCYFPFIDRDCDPTSDEKYLIPKFTLYQWYGPRRIIKEAGRRA